MKLTTTMSGKTYNVHLVGKDRGQPVVWIRVERTLEDGSVVEAFLSARQHKAETAIRRRFANEIRAHLFG